MASLPLALTDAGLAFPPAPRLALVPVEQATPTTPEPREPAARLSASDWAIVALAERDSLASLREPGRLARAMELLFGLRQANKLANSRSETLRRIAVWSWRRGWTLPKSEIQGFLDAGFTLAQLELIQASVARGRARDSIASKKRRRAR